MDSNGLAAAREAVLRAGLGDRVRILEGDVAIAVPQASFDIMVMVEVLHEIAPQIRPSVVPAYANSS